MTRRARILAAALLLSALGACALLAARSPEKAPASQAQVSRQPFTNPYQVAEDTGERVAFTYFFRRAWVQLTRDLQRTEVPPTIPLDLEAMGRQGFAVGWLGHAAMLVRAGELWVLIDPVLSDTAGPVQGFGPARLTPLPLPPEALPHIDVVLTSHDHFDHLDLGTVTRLARQAGGPPRFFVGRGLAPWFRENAGVQAQEFGWWDAETLGTTVFRFVPAQHNSGRSLFHKNTSLWGGWVVGHEGKQLYFPGDTGFVAELFEDIRRRVGPIDLAALPIGAYEPRPMMRFEHLNPTDALHAHRLLQATQSFGVHWGTFQLGDEEPFQAAHDLAAAMKARPVQGFGLIPVGGFLPVQTAAGVQLPAPDEFRPAYAGVAK